MSNVMCRLLGAKLREIREARGLVLKDVERISGISATHISEIERARTAPTMQLLGRLAKALEIPTDYLLEIPPVDSYNIRSPGDRRVLESPDGLASLERLSESCSSAPFVLQRVRLKADGVLSGEVPPTEDLIIVKQGRVSVVADEETHALSSGMGFHHLTKGRILITNTAGGDSDLLWATRSGYTY